MRIPGQVAHGRLALEIGFGALGTFMAIGVGNTIIHDDNRIDTLQEYIAPVEQTIDNLGPQVQGLTPDSVNEKHPQYYHMQAELQRAQRNVDAYRDDRNGYIPYVAGGVAVAALAGWSLRRNLRRAADDREFQRQTTLRNQQKKQQ